MGFIGLLAVGVGLSMDAFAVSICKGLGMNRINWLHAFVIALFFGVFQGAMPLIGWLLGAQFERFITPVDHWIAFLLLAFIGGKMLKDAFSNDSEEEACACAQCAQRLDLKELTMMAVATSIDALAVGITFAFLGVNIALAVVVIGVVTFAICLAGVAVGNVFGSRFEKPATIVGGVTLFLIGLKVLLEHLGFIAF